MLTEAKGFLFFIAALILLVPQAVFSAGGDIIDPSGKIPVLTYRIVKSYPHDPGAFTQGLVIDNGVLFEGTGRKGRSSLRRVDLTTGSVQQQHSLLNRFFGEGITVFGDSIFQLTWKSGTGFVYDKESFQLTRVFSFPFEGWGITHDGEFLIASDGTANLRFIDPVTLTEIRRLEVVDRAGPVIGLNELEYVEGRIYANVWQTDRIAVIDPATGRVTAWIDLAGLFNKQMYAKPVDVLNGIAYDGEQKRLYVTGKLWPSLFHIEVVEKY